MIGPRHSLPLILVALLLSPATAGAADTYADTAGSSTNDCMQPISAPGDIGPCDTIQAAINTAGPGDTVHVVGGPYSENLTLSGGKTLSADGALVTVNSPDCLAPALSISATMDSRVENLTISGTACTLQTGIDLDVDAATMTFLRLQVTGFGTGITMDDVSVIGDGAVKLDNDVVQATGVGIVANEFGEVTARNVTIDAATQGISLTNSHLTLESSILASGGISGTDCTISHSRGPVMGTDCSGFSTIATPGFAPASYALAAGSAMIDAGNPGSTVPGPDAYGGSRVLDGDGNCATPARIDIGADEFDPGGAPCFWPVTTGVAQSALRELLSITSSGPIGNYRLCVDGPKKKQCKRFRTRRSGGVDRSTVDWSRKFAYRGPGAYAVTWFTANGRQRLGTPQSFVWGACAPSNLSMRGVWRPSRLIIVDRCFSSIGRPHTISHSNQDGDYHISFRHEEPKAPGVLEVIPRDQPRHIPKLRSGRRYRITGVFVCDTFHGPLGHTEIHPVFQTELLGDGNRVLQTKTGGPQYPGTPSVSLRPRGRFHCPGIA